MKGSRVRAAVVAGALALGALAGAPAIAQDGATQGGTIVFAHEQEMTCLNPLRQCGGGVVELFSNALHTRTFVRTADFQLLPGLLAGEPELTEDPFTVTYVIREDADWPDQDERTVLVTAEDEPPPPQARFIETKTPIAKPTSIPDGFEDDLQKRLADEAKKQAGAMPQNGTPSAPKKKKKRKKKPADPCAADPSCAGATCCPEGYPALCCAAGTTCCTTRRVGCC